MTTITMMDAYMKLTTKCWLDKELSLKLNREAIFAFSILMKKHVLIKNEKIKKIIHDWENGEPDKTI